MKLSRRNVLLAIGIGTTLPMQWTKPMINSVLLPAHAQTSECDTSDINGLWEISISNGSPSIFTLNFDEENVLFSNEIMFEIHTPLTDTVYTADTTNDDCTTMGGSYNNFAGVAGPDSPVTSGTWTAKKISS